jgi:hypothetical protein
MTAQTTEIIARQCPPWCDMRTLHDHMDATGRPEVHSSDTHIIDLILHPARHEDGQLWLAGDGSVGYENVMTHLEISPDHAAGPHVKVVPMDSADCAMRLTLAEAERLVASIMYWVATARAPGVPQ